MKITLQLNNPQDAIDVLKIAADDLEIGVARGNSFPGRDIYRQIAAQIEAQIPKPRIPEPGKWAVVQDFNANLWLRWSSDWISVGARGVGATWDDIVDPVLIREGI